MKRPIYLDYAATTPCDPRVMATMDCFLGQDGNFGNPASSSHCYGWSAEEAVAQASRDVAMLIGAHPKEIIWTSGATESDNLAIKGAALFYQNKGRHLITVKTEHKAVLDTCGYLEKNGFCVTYLTPDCDGMITLSQVQQAIREDTVLISVMHVNNETGVIQDIAAIGELAHDHGLIFHVDATQSVGKLLVDVNELNVDLMSFSGHKIYGPKGIGVLYVRRKPRVRLEPLIHGGGHQHGLRSGTLASHQIVGMAEACNIASETRAVEYERIRALREQFCTGINELDGVVYNGCQNPEHCIPGIVNISFKYIDGEALLMALDALAVSTGSACNSASISPSHVLSAMGLDDELAHNAIRFSIGRYTTKEDINIALANIIAQVNRLRSISPLWEQCQQELSPPSNS